MKKALTPPMALLLISLIVIIIILIGILWIKVIA